MRLFFLKRWLRFTAAVLAAAFLFALTGCGSSTNSASFTWFVDSIPANLDPQVASGASDVIACENLYGTLVRKDPDGELVPGLCEKWTVSSDGLTYTFTLKDGLTYAAAKGAATEYDITAEDFVFAFRRIFHAETASPYAVEFSAIQNSAAVLAGLADERSLGVSANGALTLVFRLSERDDNFLAKLAMPGAAPCDEAFFESTRGTYGLTAKTTLASGSFYLYNWTTNGLFLRRTVESPLVGSLRLVQDTSGSGKSAAQLIADGKCSAALDESGEATSLQTVSYSDTTWALLFNAAEGSVFQNQQLRQALAGIARENATVPSGGLYAAAKGLVPEGLTVDGLDYRDAAGDPQKNMRHGSTVLLVVTCRDCVKYITGPKPPRALRANPNGPRVWRTVESGRGDRPHAGGQPQSQHIIENTKRRNPMSSPTGAHGEADATKQENEQQPQSTASTDATLNARAKSSNGAKSQGPKKWLIALIAVIAAVAVIVAIAVTRGKNDDANTSGVTKADTSPARPSNRC